MEKKKYYVYQHKTTTDGRVYYVGMGKKSRCFETQKGRRTKEWFSIYEKEGLVVEILLETTDEERASKRESEYIQKYGRIYDGGTLVNKATFKNGVKGKKYTEETKQKISEAKKGQGSKQVLQYSKDGMFIKEWYSVKVAAKELNISRSGISMVCNGKRNHTGGFIWKYK